jgi:trehalose 6-phosphate synthase
MSRRLLIVSNRGPVEVDASAEGVRLVRTVGGLASALDDTLRAHGGMWIAWVGAHAADDLPTDVTGLPYPIRAVRLKERDLNDYYAGFANQVMWPLCHMFPSRVRLQPTYWNAYRHANERFAAAVQAVVAPGDLVWVHDFHLCLVPGLLRASGVPARIGVFWHIPFPPPSVFGILRWRTDVLAGMLGADFLAFQTQPTPRTFWRACASSSTSRSWAIRRTSSSGGGA